MSLSGVRINRVFVEHGSTVHFNAVNTETIEDMPKCPCPVSVLTGCL